MFWYKLPIDFYDPKKIGDKYESIVDPTFIIEYVKTEGPADDPIFVFNNKTSEIRLSRSALKSCYRRWNDPWIAQKVWAAKFGFTWKDEETPPAPKVKIDY